MEWVASTLHTTSEHGVSSITTADTHTSAASNRLNWRPRRFKWTRPFRRKRKSGFCSCAVTFQTQSTRTEFENQMSALYRTIFYCGVASFRADDNVAAQWPMQPSIMHFSMLLSPQIKHVSVLFCFKNTLVPFDWISFLSLPSFLITIFTYSLSFLLCRKIWSSPLRIFIVTIFVDEISTLLECYAS